MEARERGAGIDSGSAAVPLRERLIFALDVADRAAAEHWIRTLGDSVGFYKIGMELLASGAYFEVLDLLARHECKVFVDLKFLDVPATVAAAVRGLSRWPVHFCTIHAQHRAMMQAAAEAKGALRLLAVSVLTSIDADELRADGDPRAVDALVLARARAAAAAGCDGVVCSGHEAAAVRAATAAGFAIVCPGIRPDGGGGDDQRRTVDVRGAFAAGASHIVVGRPIRNAPDPRAAAEAMQAQIAAACG